MAKDYQRTSSIHEPAANRRGDKDVRIVTQPIRLDRNVGGQNRRGNGNPNGGKSRSK